jgi:SAM-dependent methyltransferase
VPQSKYYWTVELHDLDLWAQVLDIANGKEVLELGCFTGERTVEVSQVAHRTVAIDISKQAVTSTRSKLSDCSSRKADVLVASAEALPFREEAFDLIFGFGIIHHVEVRTLAQELRRLLRPGGYAMFREPLGHNPLINLYRWATPGVRTADERPLTTDDLLILKEHLVLRDVTYFGLTVIAAAPFRQTVLGAPIRFLLNAFDRLVLHASLLQKYAWQVNLIMQKQR